MRVHPITLALRYLKGQRSFRGRTIFESEADAIAVLRQGTGQDFGPDASKWGKWLRANRRVYSTPPDSEAEAPE